MSYIRYANQGATRNQPLAPSLMEALSFLPELGLELEVFSGGQPAKGSGGARVGSTRHDHGNAADVFLLKDGQRLDWANPEHQPIFQDAVRRMRSNGVTGIGAGDGYMQPGSMHVGFGAPAVWGAGGRGSNAPDWLRQAYYGAEGQPSAPRQPASTQGTTGGQPMNPTISTSGQSPMQQQMPEKEIVGGMIGKMFPNLTPDRLDRISLALMSLSGFPTPGMEMLMQGTQQRIGDRQTEKKDQARLNKTMEFFKDKPNGSLYAGAIQAGADPKGVLNSYIQTASASKDPNVQSSDTLPDQSGTVLTMRDGSVSVITVGGQKLSGQEAMDFVRKAQETYTAQQRDIYGARRGGTLDADIDQGRAAESEKAAGKVEGTAEAEAAVAAPGNLSQAQQGIALIDSIMNDPALPKITGMIQGRLPPMTQDGTDLNVKIEQLQGKAFLEAFESLKGGGAITEREGLAAQNAMARLQRAQSTEAYTAALSELRGIMTLGMERAQRQGGSSAPDDDALFQKYGVPK